MKIVVCGDAMRDIDIHCEIVKWYEESPVLREVSRVERPGGAANVARMCEALGAQVFLVSGCPKGIKQRFLVDGRMVVRYDIEQPIQKTAALHDFHLEWAEAIIVADHGKGSVTTDLMQLLPKEIPIFIDPVQTTPVIHGEHITWVGSENEIPEQATGRKILKRGAAGVSFLFGCEISLPSTCADVVDDIGAGDQMLSSLAVARLQGLDWPEAIEQANADAGEQCRRPGIVPIERAFQ